MPTRQTSQSDQGQIDRFKELARELGCDENEAVFDATLKKIANVEVSTEVWAEEAHIAGKTCSGNRPKGQY